MTHEELQDSVDRIKAHMKQWDGPGVWISTECVNALLVERDALRQRVAEVTQERDDLIMGAIERDESFTAMTAERDALKAKLDAVPVGAIDGLIFGNDDDDIFSDKYIASTNAVAAWLETQVQP